MSTPRFNPEPTPTVQVGKRLAPDLNALPLCELCGAKEERDVGSGLCRPCWRVQAAVTRVLERWLGSPGERFVDGTKPPYVKGGPSTP